MPNGNFPFMLFSLVNFVFRSSWNVAVDLLRCSYVTSFFDIVKLYIGLNRGLFDPPPLQYVCMILKHSIDLPPRYAASYPGCSLIRLKIVGSICPLIDVRNRLESL